MLLRQWDYSKSEYKQHFKEQIEVLEAYNMGVISGNSPGAMAREIAILGIKTDTTGGAKKAQITARGKYLATVFLLRSESCRYGELILSLKK